MRTMRGVHAACLLAMLNVGHSGAWAQQDVPAPVKPASDKPASEKPAPAAEPPEPDDLPKVTPEMLSSAVESGVKVLLAAQGKDGADKDQWAYEGVYRVRGQIPVGYRIGGTCIAVQALTRAPGYEKDDARQDAVKRAIAYVCTAREHADMSMKDYAGGYDVRAWGAIEAAWCLSLLTHEKIVPKGLEKDVQEALQWYVTAVEKWEMPQTGGWNYARPAGVETVGPPSPFMTARALQALFEAKRVGVNIDGAVVKRGLESLARSRKENGEVIYSGAAKESRSKRDETPGAVGRMCATEATLAISGSGDQEKLAHASESFVKNWKWLNVRRAKTGTHVGPYGVAPYYFMFAHFHAAQAAERLEKEESRREAREKMNALLFSVRGKDGSWNDRVFDRSGAYGTAMAMLAIMQPEIAGKAAGWEKD